MKKLTIAIPTFNGSKTIEAVILGIQAAIGSEDVDILISDNHSIDGTREILKRLSFGDSLKVFYQPENLGYDRNIDFIIKNSDSDYVWLVGDDDIVDKNAIEDILSALSSFNEISHIFIGGTSVEEVL